MLTLGIEHAAAATDVEAAAILAEAFPEAGEYVLAGPDGMYGIHFSDPAATAADPLAIWREVFPWDGTYVVKAKGAGDVESTVTVPKRMPRWWLEALLSDATAQFPVRLRDLFMQRVDALVARYGGVLASPDARLAVEELLGDFRLAIKWSVGVPLPAAVESRLRAAGLTADELVRFPGMAYRLGMIETALDKDPTLDLKAILRLARAVPLNPADERAIAYASAQAGDALTPVLMRDPLTALTTALEHERTAVQRMTAEAVGRDMGTQEFARMLRAQLAPEGVVRDFDRVARTEMQEARVRGAFAADASARGWTPETLVFRTVAAVPCNECLALYKTDEGMPRVYRVGELLAQDAMGWNRKRPYHARVGTTHPHCLCSPWVTWRSEHRALYEPDRAKWVAALKRRGLGGD